MRGNANGQFLRISSYALACAPIFCAGENGKSVKIDLEKASSWSSAGSPRRVECTSSRRTPNRSSLSGELPAATHVSLHPEPCAARCWCVRARVRHVCIDANCARFVAQESGLSAASAHLPSWGGIRRRFSVLLTASASACLFFSQLVFGVRVCSVAYEFALFL